MRFTKQEKNYVLGFIDDCEKPLGISVVYNSEGYYGGKHTVSATINGVVGVIEIMFSQSDIWGYVNSLGVCKVNGFEIKTETLIGEYKYSRDGGNLINILEKLADC